MHRSVEDRELFRRWRADRDSNARDELVSRYMPLARKLARRYSHTSEPFDDLFQVASLGLVKSIDRFDPDRRSSFTSFAVPTILGELRRHFRDTTRSIHLPRGLQELMLRVQTARLEFSSRTGTSPTVPELAEYLEVDSEQVIEAIETSATHRPESLDAPIEAGAEVEVRTGHDIVGADDEMFGMLDSSVSLATAIRGFAPNDRLVLALRFHSGLTQREIATRIGVSQMQVSRILRRLTEQMREAIGLAEGPPPRRRGAHRSSALR
jgi:RNA polymerase sigma-B factor